MEDPRKYIRIADGIRNEIMTGKRQARDLVSITYLTQEHDVARQTAAKALALLAREGLVKRFPGIGYIVTQAAEGKPPSSRTGTVATVALALTGTILDPNAPPSVVPTFDRLKRIGRRELRHLSAPSSELGRSVP